LINSSDVFLIKGFTVPVFLFRTYDPWIQISYNTNFPYLRLNPTNETQ